MHRTAFVRAVVALALVGACRMRDESAGDGTSANGPPGAATAATRTQGKAGTGSAPKLGAKPRLVRASVQGGDVAAAVRQEATLAQREGREVIVYVGATWCEPCQRFHAALEEGRLDEDFPKVSFVEFDLDEERSGLARAGYASRLIPLFAIPKEDGTSTGKHVEGGIKGDGAVTELAGRLRALLLQR